MIKATGLDTTFYQTQVKDAGIDTSSYKSILDSARKVANDASQETE